VQLPGVTGSTGELKTDMPSDAEGQDGAAASIEEAVNHPWSPRQTMKLKRKYWIYAKKLI